MTPAEKKWPNPMLIGHRERLRLEGNLPDGPRTLLPLWLQPLAHVIACAVAAECRHRGLYYEGTDDPGCWERERMARRYNSEVGNMAYIAIEKVIGLQAARILRFVTPPAPE